MPENTREIAGNDSAAIFQQPGRAAHESPGSSAVRAAYLPQLDGLRALAILMVFLHHALNVPLLWAGVDLFFILSGYLITNILVRDSDRMQFGPLLGHFYLRRARRILPAYALALLFIAVVAPQDWRRLWPFYAFFLQNIPYALNWLSFGPLVPFWSLAVEQHFYLVWPFLVFFLPRRWLGPCLLTLLLGEPLLRAVCTPLFPTAEYIYALTPFRLDSMAAGALAAIWLPRCPVQKTLRWAKVAIVLGLVAYVLLSTQPWFRRGANTAAFNSLAYSLNLLILGGVFVITALAPPQCSVNQFLASEPLRALGRISYSFYLLHLLILQRVYLHLGRLPGAVVAFTSTVLLATLSWKLLEEPILKLGGRAHRGASTRPNPT